MADVLTHLPCVLFRYSFNDTHQAPIWFQDAEKKYNKRMMPVTKAQVEEMKMRAMEVRMPSK